MRSDTYILVQWPESQDYMNEPWFQEEAILALGCEEQVGSSAYFIPRNRIITSNEDIKNEVYDLLSGYNLTDEELRQSDKEWNSAIPFEGGMSFSEALIEAARNIKK